VDFFWFVVCLFFLAALCTLKKIKDTSVLGREQSDEWKGWMQFIFLLYHYYHASPVYNSVRVMIDCYVWMTGFGNFSFFYMKGDFGFVRFVQMLWRLNFVVMVLSLLMGNTYILYYICPLHTFFFCLVYLTMWVGKKWNYDKYKIRIKLMVVALFIYVLYDIPSSPLFSMLFGWWLPTNSVSGASNGTMWEWFFDLI